MLRKVTGCRRLPGGLPEVRGRLGQPGQRVLQDSPSVDGNSLDRDQCNHLSVTEEETAHDHSVLCSKLVMYQGYNLPRARAMQELPRPKYRKTPQACLKARQGSPAIKILQACEKLAKPGSPGLDAWIRLYQ